MHSLLPSLEELELISLPQLDFFPEGGLPSKLNSLCIQDCIKLKVCGLQSLTSLSHFLFVGKDDLESFPEETMLPSTLVTLKIQDLRNLKSLDYKGLKHLTSLSKLEIWRCPQLESMPEEGLPSSLEYLQLWNLANLKSLEFKGLQHLTCLRQLMISDCPKLESMPEEGLPSSLEYLNILNLTNLKSLGYKGLQQLSSLHKLNIWSCPKLESMPEQGLPSSLEYLEIGDCPLLEKRCRKEMGEDWPKISHIPFINIQAFRRIRN
ncbi:PREDICTED: putative disease resistance protein At3g14460 [Populus euphratica]|uniref:Disease resistance protein At3g14460 n=1 Tax=Populus euphratica TaxID=75702 RepID=A0AAJ6Y9Q4_POPEU|nr:PREDICTED: putative disease resistance protein At3g14460 [Populus euphratica]